MKHIVPKSICISEETTPDRDQTDLTGTWVAEDTNHKILFARYENGGHFSPHTDGYSIVDYNHRSMYTLLIYLNTCAGGGGTKFYSNEQMASLEKDPSGRFTGQKEHELGICEAVSGRYGVGPPLVACRIIPRLLDIPLRDCFRGLR
eukprot:m.863367 g.863367  ORF g.863367 m.863367 type:complete len:147 (-) comp23542_c0_seq9:2144-2584(-)